MTLLRDIIKQLKKRNKMDEYEVGEFNKICNFGYKLLILLMLIVPILYTYIPSFNRYYSLTLSIISIISFVCLINIISMCRKGLLVLNHNIELLVPAIIFFPFFVAHSFTIFFHFILHRNLGFVVWIWVWIITMILQFVIINFIYAKNVKGLDEYYAGLEKDL